MSDAVETISSRVDCPFCRASVAVVEDAGDVPHLARHNYPIALVSRRAGPLLVPRGQVAKLDWWRVRCPMSEMRMELEP